MIILLSLTKKLKAQTKKKNTTTPTKWREVVVKDFDKNEIETARNANCLGGESEMYKWKKENTNF